jgi:hypothetical protein
MVVLSIAIGALFSGITFGMRRNNLASEEIRATQIMVEKLEALRLYDLDKLLAYFDPDDPEDLTDPFDSEDPHVPEDDLPPFVIPTTFTAPFKPGATNTSDLVYTGSFQIAPAGVSEAYSNDLLLVTVRLNWESRGIAQSREMQTYVARYGMRYVRRS